MKFKRGDIYLIKFRSMLTKKYPNGKPKFVLVLQEGRYFSGYDTVEVLIVTSDKDSDGYKTNVKIEIGETKLPEESWIICAQPMYIPKSWFRSKDVKNVGTLSPEKMLDVDKAIFQGLCMKLDVELEKDDPITENIGAWLLGAAVVGGLIGAAGVAMYYDKKSKTKPKDTLLLEENLHSEDDEAITSTQSQTSEVFV